MSKIESRYRFEYTDTTMHPYNVVTNTGEDTTMSLVNTMSNFLVACGHHPHAVARCMVELGLQLEESYGLTDDSID